MSAEQQHRAHTGSGKKGRTLMAVKVSTSDTDEELEGMFKHTMANIEQLQNVTDNINVTFYTSEFDEDPRELWQIEAAKTLFRRLVNMGAYGLVLYPAQFKMRTLAEEMLGDDDLMNMFWMPLSIIHSTDGFLDLEAMQERLKISCCIFNAKFDNKPKEQNKEQKAQQTKQTTT